MDKQRESGKKNSVEIVICAVKNCGAQIEKEKAVPLNGVFYCSRCAAIMFTQTMY